MHEIQEPGKPLPLRQTEDGTWEVQNRPGHWIACYSELDAKTVADAPVVLERTWYTVPPDADVAAELEKTADMLEKYNIGFGSRFLRWRAKHTRGEVTED